jgi:hypothetical protein
MQYQGLGGVMRIGWHVVPLGQTALVTPWSLDPHGVGGAGAGAIVHGLFQVPSALQVIPEPIDEGGQACFPPVGTDVPSRAVQFAWAPVGNARAAKAVNANSVAKVREVMVNPRALWPTEIISYGLSTVSISSRANGALGEHRRHDTDGMRLEIAAPDAGRACADRPSQTDHTLCRRTTTTAAPPRRQRQSSGRTTARDGDDLPRFRDGLAFSLGTLGLGRCLGGCALAILRSAVRTHDGKRSRVTRAAPLGSPLGAASAWAGGIRQRTSHLELRTLCGPKTWRKMRCQIDA